MQEPSLETAEEFWTKEQGQKIIPLGNPLDILLKGGIRRGLIHGIIMPKALMGPIYHQLLLNYATEISRENWKPIMLIEGINKFDPYLLSKLALSHRIHPNALLDLVQVARAFQYNQIIELVEERLPMWVKQNERPGMIIVAGLNNEFENMIDIDYSRTSFQKKEKPALNLKPFKKLTQALGQFNNAIQSRPYIVFLLTPHSKSNTKAAGGTFLHHYCNILAHIIPNELNWIYSLDQHPFIPEQSIQLPIVNNSKRRKHKEKQKKFQNSTKTLDRYL